MRPEAGPLPQHDDISRLTRGLETASLLAAAAALAAHGYRLATTPGVLAWWLPVVVLAGVVLADLVSGLVHWTADTWGSESLPVVGRRFLRPFRVHHTNPDDFLRRSFLDTNGDVAMLCVPILVAGFLIPLDTGPGRLAAVALVAFCAGVLPTNQVHQWAHRTDPPGWVGWLQRRGLLLGHAQHQRHHVAPFAVNYCISTGWCNRPLTAVGFFPALERVVGRLTGLTPRGEDQVFSARYHPTAELP